MEFNKNKILSFSYLFVILSIKILLIINYFFTKESFINNTTLKLSSDKICNSVIEEFITEEKKVLKYNSVKFFVLNNEKKSEINSSDTAVNSNPYFQINIKNNSVDVKDKATLYNNLEQLNISLTRCYDEVHDFNIRCGVYISEAERCINNCIKNEISDVENQCNSIIEDLEICNVYNFIEVKKILGISNHNTIVNSDEKKDSSNDIFIGDSTDNTDDADRVLLHR